MTDVADRITAFDRELYGKLGFDELGRFWSFVKSPD